MKFPFWFESMNNSSLPDPNLLPWAVEPAKYSTPDIENSVDGDKFTFEEDQMVSDFEPFSLPLTHLYTFASCPLVSES